MEISSLARATLSCSISFFVAVPTQIILPRKEVTFSKLTESPLSTILDLSLSGDISPKRKTANLMAKQKKSNPFTNNSISISGDVKDSAVNIGDNNTVNQTIIQKFFNIFKSDSESMEQNNRRILLNTWKIIFGVSISQ